MTKNGVTEVLTGNAKNEFLNNVVEKFEKSLGLEPSGEPRKRGGPFDVPRGAPKPPRPDE